MFRKGQIDEPVKPPTPEQIVIVQARLHHSGSDVVRGCQQLTLAYCRHDAAGHPDLPEF